VRHRFHRSTQPGLFRRLHGRTHRDRQSHSEKDRRVRFVGAL
jgi:hypothetical protein